MSEALEIPKHYLPIYNAIANAEGSITKDKILLQIGRDEKYTRKLHEIIHSLIVDYNVPIGSSSKKEIKGYFLIKTDRQRAEALKSLNSRVGTIEKRERVIRNSLKSQASVINHSKASEEIFDGIEVKDNILSERV